MGAPRIGVRVPQYGSGWTELRDGALRAEALGFDGVWVNDHLQSPGRVKAEPAFDALTTLAALAALTSRVRLGTVVLSASYRPPALAAKAVTILDVISGGRVVVGLGTGSDVAEHAAYGFPFPPPRERTAGLRTALATMRAMFAEPAGADLPGVLAGAPNLPAPVQRGGPPIWLAAHGPRLLRLAGERADGIVAAFCGAGEVARRLAIADAAREAAGRPPLACALYTYALPVPSAAEAESWLAPEARALGTTPAKLLRWLRTTGIVAPPDELREALAEVGRAGATDAVLVLPDRTPPEALEALAEATLAAPGPPGGGGGAPGATHATPTRSARAEHNLVELVVERHARGDLAGAPAAIDEDGAWTFAELSAATARAAGALRAAGARRGDRVIVALRDGRPWLQAFLGAARMGAVPVPVDPAADGERLADLVDDCEPAVVVAAEGAEVPAGPVALAPGALDAGRAAPIAAVHPADLAYLVYSSGSTGRPKGVMHAHGDMRAGIETYARTVLGLEPGDRCHSMARLFTSLGFGNGFFRVLGRGATAVLTGTRPTPRGVLATVEEHGVTVLTGVPTHWAQLATFLERHPGAGSLASVRLAVSSGDSLPAPVAERLRGAAGLDLIEGLGCSECSNVVISTRPGEPYEPGVLGRAVEGLEVRLADDEGRPVDEGEPGRLWIRSDSNTTGYWRRPEATRDLVHGPWLRMGDMLVARDGRYRHMGRADDLFKVDARWVSPAAVEAALLGHPAVAEAAVVGAADDEGLLRPAAFVVTAPGADPAGDFAAELRRHVAHALEAYMAPRTVTVVDELPRLPSGKLDRRRLRGAEGD
ncbi:LLM class flavin-dependent oxidoreductase [Miltoncostaea marina]|uniref:LLM class flavin-dependent oxidoreductase n=1 Tax=Miltoncostaea marina TaxID=2843215 RepID=UPI001C3DF1EB|nr:LLM class flavin-dependent oxidoreductase [Miltoncostaea marina]